MRYLDINLTKYVQNLYAKNYRTQMKQIREDQIKTYVYSIT